MNEIAKQQVTPVLTIENAVAVLAPKVHHRDVLLWPPDAFAVTAFLLQKSGAYIQVARSWPPGKCPEAWADEMRLVGNEWRTACIQGSQPPNAIVNWWSNVTSKFTMRISDLPEQKDVVASLVQILAASDEACAGIGIPDLTDRKYDHFDNEAARLLYRSARLNLSTLTKRIDPSLFRVLPKMQTPQSGISIRSLSHHLALCTSGEVNPKWVYHPPSSTQKIPAGLNLLLIPWPLEISPLDFRAAAGQPGLRNMPENMGFFSFEQNAWKEWPSQSFKNIVAKALAEVGRIDGVILPELALKSEGEFDQAFADLTSVVADAFLISGIGGKSEHPPYDLNQVGYRIRLAAASTHGIKHTQGKHHRWRLDDPQIRQYGLTHRLDPYMYWWENTDVSERRVHFFAISPWLTISPLICEDLARQDPVADVLRAVGPNLVVALLMDGPQLQRRWSARYATVFADDPGSSVLCLTSVGMVDLSNQQLAEQAEVKPVNFPKQQPPEQADEKRIIGLWKDARGPARQIELKEGCDAVVLSLNREYCQEWTTDGRGDRTTTAYLTFGRFHNVKRKI